MHKKAFINCPYDEEYLEFFKIIVFLCAYFGYEPLFASEDKTTHPRNDKIIELIKNTDLGIHDISRITLSKNKYPRFNMPFELGMDVMYSTEINRRKKILVLDGDDKDYEKTISDLKCADIESHKNNSKSLFKIIRDYFVSTSEYEDVKSPKEIEKLYMLDFKSWLADKLKNNGFDTSDEIEMFEFKQKTMQYFDITSGAQLVTI